MAYEAAFWLRLYQAFEPSEILVGKRQALYCTREHDPYDKLVQLFRDEEALGVPRKTRPPLVYFTGHRGSGKSSLLFKLLEHYKAEFFVVYVNVSHNLDNSKAHLIDVLYLLGFALFQAGRQEGLKLNERLLEDLVEKISTITEKETGKKDEALNVGELAKGLIVFTAGVLGNKIGEKLAEAVLKPFSLSSGVTEEQAKSRTVEPQIQHILTQINLIVADIESESGKRLMVIVDDLDKIQRQEQAEAIFLQSRALHGPICRIIYTVPMLVYTDLPFGEVEQDANSYFLPNVRLYSRLDRTKRHEKGYAEMREVAEKRLQTLQLTETELFAEGVLNQLIFKSGGLMRWFIRLVNEACRSAERRGTEKVTMDAAQEAIADLLAESTRRLSREAKVELKKVHEEHSPSNSKESNDLIHAFLILAYQNGSTWFDAHPLIWDEI